MADASDVRRRNRDEGGGGGGGGGGDSPSPAADNSSDGAKKGGKAPSSVNRLRRIAAERKKSLLGLVVAGTVAAIGIWNLVWSASTEGNFPVMSSAALATHTAPPSIYVSVLGSVFDVTPGARHYGPSGSYHAFAGKDASKAYVTGDFTKDGLIDDIGDLSPQNVIELAQWLDFYETHNEYKQVAVLRGRFYDARGNPAPALLAFQEELKKARTMAQEDEVEQQSFPGCNSRWSQAAGGEVWCSKDSGGIKRDWVGVPRQRMRVSPMTGKAATSCVCVHEENLDSPDLREYDDCEPEESRCKTS